ncbi:NOL1/NOP2/sun family putative RNA methylase [archaeon]|nr:NOL1/NOP2/sun family putative RNA methylase [archaeon]
MVHQRRSNTRNRQRSSNCSVRSRVLNAINNPLKIRFKTRRRMKYNMELKREFKERSRELLGSEAEDYFQILREPLTNALRINTLKITINALKKRLKNKDWELKPVPFCKQGYWVESGPMKLGSTLEHFLGYYYIQDPASMIPPLTMDLREEQKVLDIAASPGSKTGQIVSIMNDEGLIIANDVRIDRVSILKINLQRIGARSVVITRRNGMNYKKMTGFFDRVLVDAPCSGEGVIRKNPYAAVQWNPNSFPKFSRVQKKLIKAGYQALKPGGLLVYSTCSLAPEENEEVIDYLLKNSDAEVEQIKIKGLKSKPGVTEWQGEKYHKEINKCIRVYPQDNNTEGFFVCKVRKR